MNTKINKSAISKYYTSYRDKKHDYVITAFLNY